MFRGLISLLAMLERYADGVGVVRCGADYLEFFSASTTWRLDCTVLYSSIQWKVSEAINDIIFVHTSYLRYLYV